MTDDHLYGPDFALKAVENLGFIEQPPDPFAQVPALAKRLGVAPVEGTGGMGILIQTKTGERYDFLALIGAFLDRMDKVLPP